MEALLVLLAGIAAALAAIRLSKFPRTTMIAWMLLLLWASISVALLFFGPKEYPVRAPLFPITILPAIVGVGGVIGLLTTRLIANQEARAGSRKTEFSARRWIFALIFVFPAWAVLVVSSELLRAHPAPKHAAATQSLVPLFLMGEDAPSVPADSDLNDDGIADIRYFDLNNCAIHTSNGWMELGSRRHGAFTGWWLPDEAGSDRYPTQILLHNAKRYKWNRSLRYWTETDWWDWPIRPAMGISSGKI